MGRYRACVFSLPLLCAVLKTETRAQPMSGKRYPCATPPPARSLFENVYGSWKFTWELPGFLPFLREARNKHFPISDFLAIYSKVGKNLKFNLTITNTAESGFGGFRTVYFSHILSPLSRWWPMATILRRGSFFHLLWEKRNCTQEMSQSPWEAQHPLQGGTDTKLGISESGRKE